MTDAKTKRITLPINRSVDVVRDRLKQDTGIDVSYAQVFNFLIHFYMERANEPKTKWRGLL